MLPPCPRALLEKAGNLLELIVAYNFSSYCGWMFALITLVFHSIVLFFHTWKEPYWHDHKCSQPHKCSLFWVISFSYGSLVFRVLFPSYLHTPLSPGILSLFSLCAPVEANSRWGGGLHVPPDGLWKAGGANSKTHSCNFVPVQEKQWALHH